jgi:hypothetical protein
VLLLGLLLLRSAWLLLVWLLGLLLWLLLALLAVVILNVRTNCPDI